MQKDGPHVGFQGFDFGAKSDIYGGGDRLHLSVQTVDTFAD